MSALDRLNENNPHTTEIKELINKHCSRVLDYTQMSINVILDEMTSDKAYVSPLFDKKLDLMFFVFGAYHSKLMNMLTKYHLHEEQWQDKKWYTTFIDGGRGWYMSGVCRDQIEIWTHYKLSFQQRHLFYKLWWWINRR